MRRLALFPFILLSSALLAGQGVAQEAVPARVQACADIEDKTARLACFDAAIAAYRTAAPSATVMAQPKAEASKSTFGLPKPEAALSSMSMLVSWIETGADGKLRFTLQDGQVWRQTDSTPLKNLGKGPWTAEVREAALGSYMLKIDNRTPVRVKRVS